MNESFGTYACMYICSSIGQMYDFKIVTGLFTVHFNIFACLINIYPHSSNTCMYHSTNYITGCIEGFSQKFVNKKIITAIIIVRSAKQLTSILKWLS